MCVHLCAPHEARSLCWPFTSIVLIESRPDVWPASPWICVSFFPVLDDRLVPAHPAFHGGAREVRLISHVPALMFLTLKPSI